MTELALRYPVPDRIVAARSVVDRLLDQTAQSIQRIACSTIEPIKGRLPPSLLITAEHDTSLTGWRRGIYTVWEFLPGEGKIVVVTRQYLEERKTADGRTHVCTLDQPQVHFRSEGGLRTWNTHGRLVIERLERAAIDLQHGREVLSASEEMARTYLIRVSSPDGNPL